MCLWIRGAADCRHLVVHGKCVELAAEIRLELRQRADTIVERLQKRKLIRRQHERVRDVQLIETLPDVEVTRRRRRGGKKFGALLGEPQLELGVNKIKLVVYNNRT